MPKLYIKLFFGEPVLDDVRTLPQWKALFKEQGPMLWGYPPDYKGNYSDWQEVGEIKEVHRVRS